MQVYSNSSEKHLMYHNSLGERRTCLGLSSHLTTRIFHCFFFFQRQLPLDPVPTCINCTAFNHNGTLCISGGSDGMIRLFGKFTVTALVLQFLANLSQMGIAC